MIDIEPNNQQETMTVVVSQVVPSCEEAEFEALLRDVIAETHDFEGQLGVDVIRPSDHVHPEYVAIFRFDSYDHLKAWRDSDEHRSWVERSQLLAGKTGNEGTGNEEIVTGGEYWLTPKSNPGQPAPRSKQALVIWMGIYPLVTLLIWVMEPYLGGLPLYVRTLVLTVILVLLMTYLVMPFLMRHLSGWLHANH